MEVGELSEITELLLLKCLGSGGVGLVDFGLE